MNEDFRAWAGPMAAPSAAELGDRFAASQLVKIYALGIDMRDYDLCRSAFTHDAMAQGSQGAMAPIDDYLPKTFAAASAFKATQHNVTNQHVRLDGDEALVWSYAIAYHKPALGSDIVAITVGVQYRDSCRRTPGGWLVAERTVVIQWVEQGSAPIR
jgi:hypothetical protein